MPTEETRMPAPSPGRLHYIDWLRVLAVLGVFVYHSLQPFSMHVWHVKNAQLSGAVEAVVSFVDPWGIAFFFLIAGASSYLALRRRTARQYLGERVLRLLVPLVAAYVLLSPIQAFIEARHFGRYAGSFVGGLPLFFKQVYSELPGTLFHPLLVDYTYHLWFVVFLLWFALLGLPIFLWLRAPRQQRWVAWLGGLSRRRGAILPLAIPLLVPSLAVLPLAPDSEDWGTFVYLFGFFVAGYVLMSDQRLMAAVRRDVLPALLTAIGLDALIVLTGVPAMLVAWQSAPAYDLAYLWGYLLVGLQAWAWVNVLLGLGMRARTFARPLPRLAGAAAMPFFLIHQPVILAVAFFVVRMDVDAVLKWFLIAVPSLALSALLAVAVTRLPIVSVLFGVKRAGAAGVEPRHADAGRHTQAPAAGLSTTRGRPSGWAGR